jgi:phenol 2-monooxygenase
MGAFGLNASSLDVANLGWKLGLAAKGLGRTSVLMPTYTSERRKHATRIIKVSGDYLRYISGSADAVPELGDVEALQKLGNVRQDINNKKVITVNGHSNGQTNGDANGYTNGHVIEKPIQKSDKAEDLAFLTSFFKENGQFLLGVDCTYDQSVIAKDHISVEQMLSHDKPFPLKVRSGVRAPNPRVCLSTTQTGYLYDPMAGPSRFHVVLFASSLSSSSVRSQVNKFATALSDATGFYHRFGGSTNFHIMLVVTLLPFEYAELDSSRNEYGFISTFKDMEVTVLFDDRSPDESAHLTYGVNYDTGAVAVIRPDLVMGTACCPGDAKVLQDYFDGFFREM